MTLQLLWSLKCENVLNWSVYVISKLHFKLLKTFFFLLQQRDMSVLCSSCSSAAEEEEAKQKQGHKKRRGQRKSKKRMRQKRCSQQFDIFFLQNIRLISTNIMPVDITPWFPWKQEDLLCSSAVDSTCDTAPPGGQIHKG